ncbi:amidohydrolase [Pararhizobium sp. DWP1-1-3]|uniref:amidohydrolase n=1 Tax=Pararhizobium sp. DWP1-1-3 TaxID=2804652 RepID=UPI003CE9D47E
MFDSTFIDKLTTWRRYLHIHPELSFHEEQTAQFVSEKLTALGIPHVSGVGGHGIVATLTKGRSDRSVALRADMDALPINEANDVDYASNVPGVMHACGHDGHTVSLLGAAEQLAKSDDWAGTVQLIFQPAEEKGGGAKAMLADGLLQRFPFERIFAYHNMPGIEEGTIAVHTGPVFAMGGSFQITLHGVAGHAAAPHLGSDCIVAAGHLLVALQTVVSRTINPLDPAVLTVGMIHGGVVTNQIPEIVTLSGTIRTYKPEVRQQIAEAVERIVAGVAATYGLRGEVVVNPGGQVCVNRAAEAQIAAEGGISAGAKVLRDLPPVMFGDDMGYLLAQRPGAYAWIGNGIGGPDSGLHNPRYDFNDNILPVAVGFFVETAKRALRK